MTALVDVVVVGAGPTGLTLAAQLHLLGASVRIVDRQVDRVHESRALALQPRTLEVLRGLGIAQTLVDRGNPALQVRLHSGESILSVPLFDIGLEDTPLSSRPGEGRSRRVGGDEAGRHHSELRLGGVVRQRHEWTAM
jgi:2-polyprenyl-6-methoxyphenol hydroxylase-like FAD-dependent oxidoreductase